MAKFNLIDLLNNNSKDNDPNKELNKIELISVHKLEPSADNFYNTDDVLDLQDSIEMFGVQQNIIVRKIPGEDKYKVVAGHRRRIAVQNLVLAGKKDFEMIPCKVQTDEVDIIKEKILLIHTNSTSRVLSDWEKLEQLKQLKKLLREYKKTNNVPGRVRDLLSDTLNISKAQVGRLESVEKNLSLEFKKELQQENINISTAVELSRLPEEKQKDIYKNTGGKIKLKEARKENEVKLKKSSEQIVADIDEETMLIALDEVLEEIKNRLKSLEPLLNKIETEKHKRDQKSLAKITIYKELYATVQEKIKAGQ